MKKHIIFYGAGKNARDNYEKWINSGARPVCFVDKDVSKHYTKFETSDIDILPLDDAIRKYPDFELYITPTREKLDNINDLGVIGVSCILEKY